jgi:hypothetical protein
MSEGPWKEKLKEEEERNLLWKRKELSNKRLLRNNSKKAKVS